MEPRRKQGEREESQQESRAPSARQNGEQSQEPQRPQGRPALRTAALALLPLVAALLAAPLLAPRAAAPPKQPTAAEQPAAAAAARAPAGSGGGPRHFSAEELAGYRGGEAGDGVGAPLYVAILGDVFDVTSKPEFYGAAGTYHHFTGADGSRAFVTGEFEGAARADLDGLSPEDVAAVVGWRRFYFETYPYMGRLVGGLYYTPDGRPTPRLLAVVEAAQEGERLKKLKEDERLAAYVDCDASYSPSLGGRVACSGGRYPRKLFDGMGGGAAAWRCVCMEGLGWSDLLQVYDGCAPDTTACATAPPDADAGAEGAGAAAAAAAAGT